MENVITLTFNDWMNAAFPPGLETIEAAFENSLLRNQSEEWQLYRLPVEEFEKIAAMQTTIFEEKVGFFLDCLVNRFEEQFARSLAKPELIHLELEWVEKCLTDPDFQNVVFPFSFLEEKDKGGLHSGIVILNQISKDFLKPGETLNPLPLLYDKIIKRGFPARAYAKPIGFGKKDLSSPFAVHVLFRYRNYLNQKCNLDTDTRPLAPFFHGKESLDLALKAAFVAELINEGGQWIHSGYKTNAVSVFWRAAVKTRLAKADAPNGKVSQAIKMQFGIDSLWINAIDQKRDIAQFGEPYKELYKKLLSEMRP